MRNYTLNLYFSWNLSNHLHYFFLNHIVCYYFLGVDWALYQLLNSFLHYFLNGNEYIIYYFKFSDRFLDNWNLNDSLHFLNNLLYYDSVYWYFSDLRHLHYFLDDPRHNNNFFHYLLDLYDLRDLYKFFYNFINHNPYLFDPVNVYRHLHNFIFVGFYNIWHLNIMINYLLDFDYLWLFYDYWIIDLNFLDYILNDSFDKWLSDDLRNNYYLFHNDWYLYSVLNKLLHLCNQRDDFLYQNFNLFYSVLNYQLLSNSLDLNYILLNRSYLYYFLNNLWYFNNPFLNLDNWNRLLDYSFHYFVLHLYLRYQLRLDYVLNLRHYFLHNDLNLYDLRNSNDFFHDLLNDGWHLYNFLNYGLNRNDLFNNHLYLLCLRNNVINLSLNFYYLVNLYNLLNYPFHFDYFWYLHHHLNNFLLLNRHFHYSFNYPLNWNYLLDYILDNMRYLYWNIYYFLHFFYPFHFYNLLDHLINYHNLGDLHNSLWLRLDDDLLLW